MLSNDRSPDRFTDIQPAYVNLWLTDWNDNSQAGKDQQFPMKYWSLSVRCFENAVVTTQIFTTSPCVQKVLDSKCHLIGNNGNVVPKL